MREKWFDLGGALQIQEGTLKAIRAERNDVGACLREMLSVLVRQVNPSPTWPAIIRALRTAAVDEQRLAQDLENKYCPVVAALRRSEGVFLLIRYDTP